MPRRDCRRGAGPGPGSSAGGRPRAGVPAPLRSARWPTPDRPATPPTLPRTWWAAARADAGRPPRLRLDDLARQLLCPLDVPEFEFHLRQLQPRRLRRHRLVVQRQRTTEARGRRLQLALPAVDDAQEIGPARLVGSESLGVAVGRRGGVEEIVGLVERRQPADGFGLVRGDADRPPGTTPRRPRVVELTAYGVFRRRQVGLGDGFQWFRRQIGAIDGEQDAQHQ